MSKGVISILNNNYYKKYIIDVYYVSNLNHHILSIGLLSQHGYDIRFKDSMYTILDKLPSIGFNVNTKTTKNSILTLNMESVICHVYMHKMFQA